MIYQNVNSELINDLFNIALDGVFCTGWGERSNDLIKRYTRLYGPERMKEIFKTVNYKIKRRYKIRRNAYEL